jgi:hypothetical protein
MNWKEWSDFAKNEAYWQNHEERGLLKAEHVRDYVLRLWFEEELDVSIYELDFHPLIKEDDPGEVFLPLRELERFRLVEGDYALIWLNPDTGAYDEKAIDLAPECVRFFCERYGKKLKSPKRANQATETIVEDEVLV